MRLSPAQLILAGFRGTILEKLAELYERRGTLKVPGFFRIEINGPHGTNPVAVVKVMVGGQHRIVLRRTLPRNARRLGPIVKCLEEHVLNERFMEAFYSTFPDLTRDDRRELVETFEAAFRDALREFHLPVNKSTEAAPDDIPSGPWTNINLAWRFHTAIVEVMRPVLLVGLLRAWADSQPRSVKARVRQFLNRSPVNAHREYYEWLRASPPIPSE